MPAPGSGGSVVRCVSVCLCLSRGVEFATKMPPRRRIYGLSESLASPRDLKKFLQVSGEGGIRTPGSACAAQGQEAARHRPFARHSSCGPGGVSGAQVSHVLGHPGWSTMKSERATILARVRPLSLARHSSYRGRLMPCEKPFQIASLLLFGISPALEEGVLTALPSSGRSSVAGGSHDLRDPSGHYVDMELAPENTQS